MELTEVRREDDYYENGNYWIIADSFDDILSGKYKIIGSKHYVNYDGDVIDNQDYFSTHKEAWGKLYKDIYKVNYTFYPRGRVNTYKGKIYINTNSKVSNSNIIGDVLDYYDLTRVFDKDNIAITCNDMFGDNGTHYGFDLK